MSPAHIEKDGQMYTRCKKRDQGDFVHEGQAYKVDHRFDDFLPDCFPPFLVINTGSE